MPVKYTPVGILSRIVWTAHVCYVCRQTEVCLHNVFPPLQQPVVFQQAENITAIKHMMHDATPEGRKLKCKGHKW